MTKITLRLELETARIIAAMIPDAAFLNDKGQFAAIEYLRRLNEARMEVDDADEEAQADSEEEADREAFKAWEGQGEAQEENLLSPAPWRDD